MDRAVSQYRKENPDFKARLQSEENPKTVLTADDAEQIILLATHGLLNLELSDTLL